MTPAQFQAALDSLGLTQAQAAELLDLGIRTIHGYCNGRPIPKVVELALQALKTEDDPYTDTNQIFAECDCCARKRLLCLTDMYNIETWACDECRAG